MRKLKASILVAVATVLCLAQSATEYDSPSINHIAAKLNCSCGCKLRMDCQMQPGCGVCKAAKLKILDLQRQGKGEDQILSQFVAENGPDVIAIPPGVFGTTFSYGALAVGLGIVLLSMRHYLNKRPATVTANGAPIEDALLSKYQSQIDKDLEKFD